MSQNEVEWQSYVCIVDLDSNEIFSQMITVKIKPRFVNAILVPVLGVKPKRGWYVFWLFFKMEQCSAISFKRSRRELSIDVAEHRSMLKYHENTHYPLLVSNPKQVKHSLKRMFCFYCVGII